MHHEEDALVIERPEKVFPRLRSGRGGKGGRFLGLIPELRRRHEPGIGLVVHFFSFLKERSEQMLGGEEKSVPKDEDDGGNEFSESSLL